MNSQYDTFFFANSSTEDVHLTSHHAVNALPLSSRAPIKSLPKHYLPVVYPTIYSETVTMWGIVWGKFPQKTRTSKNSITFCSQHEVDS